MRYSLFFIWVMFTMIYANYPVFEQANQLRELLIPADVGIGSVIYRLRASDSDHDYPLLFDATDYGSYVVRIENLPCLKNSTFCEANVYLERILMVGQIFKFRLTVRDTKGDTTTASVSLHVTDTPVDINLIFPHIPAIIILPEDTKVGTELEYVIVRKNPETNKPSVLEIRGAKEVSFGKIRASKETTTGVITLDKPLDFENRNMYKLQVFGLDFYANKLGDSRNIAGFELIMVVEDVQDTPPIFTNVLPIFKLLANLTVGDVIMTVIAEDGDRGIPRKIKYGLVSEGNAFTVFFNIDTRKGNISLAKPLKELTAIARSHQPVLLTILAEEEVLNKKEPPAMSATATVAFLLADVGNTPPYFDHDHYVCRLDENSPQGTALIFGDAYSTQVHDDDMGKHGVFTLTLEKNNGTFEISPNVAERRAQFTIRVRNKNPLDFETRQSLHFMIVARELGTGANILWNNASVLVYLNDVNDNAPKFQNNIYTAQIPEDAPANSIVADIKAFDLDTGLAGKVHYTTVLGYKNTSLLLNSVTGLITVATDKHGFDREESPEYRMIVQARDMEGSGLLATVPLVIRITDVNDETPVFQDTPIQFILTADSKNFSTRSFVKAIDRDVESPNNIVRYEIVSGNYEDKFMLNSETGEFTMQSKDGPTNKRKKRQVYTTPTTFVLTIRAYDLGVPQRWSSTQVRIYPPEGGARIMTFILPGRILNHKDAEHLLEEATGAHIDILEIKPYHADVGYSGPTPVTDITKGSSDSQRNIVIARVMYNSKTIVDFGQIYYRLSSLITSDSKHTKEVEYQTADSSGLLVWMLLMLILLLIIIIILLLGYFWKCFPFYSTCYRSNKDSRVSHMDQENHSYSKGTQVTIDGTESRSFDRDRKRGWWFYPGNRRGHSPAPVILVTKKSPDIQTYRRHKLHKDAESPSYVYTENLSRLQRDMDTVYVQDIVDTEYRVLDPSRLNMRTRNHQFNSTRRREDIESDFRTSIDHRNTPTSRDEIYLTDGNAEILRLSTNMDSKIQENMLNQPEPGKQIIMERFLQNPSIPNSEISKYNDLEMNTRRGQYEQNLDSNYITLHQMRETMKMSEKGERPNEFDVELKHDDVIWKNDYDAKEKKSNSYDSLNTNNETILVMKDEEFRSRNQKLVHTRNQHVSDESESMDQAVDDLEDIIDQVDQNESKIVPEELESQIKNENNRTTVVDTSGLYAESGNLDDFISLSQIEESRSRLAENNLNIMESARGPYGDIATISGLGLSKIDESRSRLACFQRDILLTRFLVEEQRRLLNQVAIDTQSLPGSLTLSMGTQTDRHRSTQTDVLGLLRPEPRKAKSENDDSSDSDVDNSCKRKKFSNGRNVTFDGKITRHKIKTPILEENENIYDSTNKRLEASSRCSLPKNLNSNNKDVDTFRKTPFNLKTRFTSVPNLNRNFSGSDELNSIHRFFSDESKNECRTIKKSISCSDMNERTCSNVIDPKDIYTPRSLRSRLLSRKRTGSEYIENLDSKFPKKEFQDKVENGKSRYMNWYKTKKEERERKKLEFEEIERKKLQMQGSGRMASSLNSNKQISNQRNGQIKGNYRENGSDVLDSNSNNLVEKRIDNTIESSSVISSSLKMKSKNQQLLEKKSVFTIAYDDANTDHIVFSSNGSAPEQ